MGRKSKPSKVFSNTNDRPEDLNRSEEDSALFLAALEHLDVNAIMREKKHTEEPTEKPKKRSRIDAMPIQEIDLHGLTVAQATVAVDQFIHRLVRQTIGPARIRVITGKGIHSGHGGGVLAREIYAHVARKYHDWIESIDSAPTDAQLGGLPLRGYFDVVMRRV